MIFSFALYSLFLVVVVNKIDFSSFIVQKVIEKKNSNNLSDRYYSLVYIFHKEIVFYRRTNHTLLIRYVTTQVRYFTWTESMSWLSSSSSYELNLLISSFYMNWTYWSVHFIWTEPVDQFILFELNLLTSSFYLNWTCWSVHFIWTEPIDQFILYELNLLISSFYLNWTCWPVRSIWTEHIDEFIPSELNLLISSFYLNWTRWSIRSIWTEPVDQFILFELNLLIGSIHLNWRRLTVQFLRIGTERPVREI
jgi:hypothetical protein